MMTGQEFKKEFESQDHIEVQTSGSTGIPKNILLSKDMLLSSARRTNRKFGIGSGSRLHSCISFDYIGGKMTLVRAYEANASLTAEHPTNHPTLTGDVIVGDVNLKKSCPIDLLSVVPSQMLWLIEKKDVLTEVRHYLIGGSSIPENIRKKIGECRIDAWESYGMTETASHIALRKVTDEVNSPFITMEGIKVRLDNRGCLVIQSGKDGEERLSYITNDIAEVISEREFRIIGRIDNTIITGGKKFHPEEGERLISKYTTLPLIFIPEIDPKWGERIVLLVERQAGLSDSEILEEIRFAAEASLQHWQIPKKIHILERLPRTPNGKLKRSGFGNLNNKL